ncbi:hypothetical protein HPB52_016808 [Rhipicephalus sanguineus]|uniref:Nlr family card domain protein n=1 Tax=Rhipicephalus sanguineus TaxID=34632 RepID=A0A9D4SSJ8_RHISA|nr:hypothetical protein HPB52_016808 [Rhipicephalus sanguineus]
MESLSEESKQTRLDAIAGRVDSFFDSHRVEHFPLRCTANRLTATHNDKVCPINDYLPICNGLLFDVGMELREQGGSLSLVCFHAYEADVMPPPDADLCRANTFLRWLLRTHVCIAGLELQYKWLTAHSQVVLDELPENSRLKKLRLAFSYGDNAKTHFAKLLPRLRCLEELDCFMSPSEDVLVDAVSALVRSTTSLTSLVFRACFDHGQPPKTFIDALAENSTLKSVEMWANWNTAEPPGCLAEYVMSNRLLTTLTLFSEHTDRQELSLDEALVRNSTLSTLRIGTLCGGETTVRFLTRILAECPSIRKLSLGGLRDTYVNIPGTTMTRCTEAMARNETLEELELSYSLWHQQNWIAFLAFLPKNKHLKKLEVSSHSRTDYATILHVLQALANTDSSGRISFGSYTHESAEVGLMRFRAFSGINFFGTASMKVYALQLLPAFDHFTSVSLGFYYSNKRVFSYLAKYIRATTTLKQLWLFATRRGEAASSSYWTLLFESISANTSITYLIFDGGDNFAYSGRLASTVGLSKYITRVTYIQNGSGWNPASFVLPLSDSIGGNYNLLEVRLTSAKLAAEARRSLFAIRETTRRNSGLLERAASAFNQTTPLDWYTATALEKVSRHPVLVREIAEKGGIAADEVATMIRSHLKSVEGLNDFMRLTGVIKERVTCAAPVDGFSMQLQGLNNDCWRLVRRYLNFDDVIAKPEEPDVMPPPDADLDRSNTFLRWLLRTHVCITRLKLQYKWVTAHSQVFLEELPENCRLKKLRVQFPSGDTVQTHFATLLPRHTANALEKVSRRPALVRELAEKNGIPVDEVASMIRRRLSSVEDLHDFMRLTGVVKECVTCVPPVCGCGVQLQDLNNDCWRLLRRYLSFDDVKRFTVVETDDAARS